MSEERTKLEIIAPSVEEAVTKGLQDLGLTEADVDVEILDEGKKGLLGLGTRQARVALKIKSPTQPAQEEFELKPQGDEANLYQEAVDESTAVEESEEVSIARETINIILEKMHINANVSVRLGNGDVNRLSLIHI